MSDDFRGEAFVGKTIKDASYFYEDGACDTLRISFTDGSSVVVTAVGCIDATGALVFDHEQQLEQGK